RALPARDALHHPAGLAQHGRGRTHVRRRGAAAEGPDLRPGQPARPDRAFRPQQHGRGLPRHGARPRPRARRTAQGVVMPASLRRISALVLRHLYILKGSWARLIELIYWPAVQMIMWGFLTQFLANQSSWVA